MDFPANSEKSKETKKDTAPEEKKLEQVVTAPAVVKQKSIGKKFKAIFFGGEFKSSFRYVTADVLLPAARDTLFDAATKGVERLVYGENVQARRGRPANTRGIVTYNRPVQRDSRSAMLPDQPPHRVARRGKESADVLITDREEAMLVLQTMVDCIDKYNVVSMADLNELIGQPIANIDHNWGWTNLTTAQIRQDRNGYLLELPPMEELR